MTPELLRLALHQAATQAPREAAALLVDIDGQPVYWPCWNTSTDNDLVTPSPVDLANAEDAGRIMGFVHSHPGGDPSPSETDLAAAEAMGLPWWVMAPSGPWTRYDPRSRPVLGRRFVFGVDDCWSICRDWFGREMGLAMPDFEREPNFWETGFEPHVEHLAAAGFVPVPFGGLQRGDGLLFRVCAKTITHCAVYLGDGWMLHHIEGMLSRKEPVDRRWMKRLAMVVRHESRVTP